uniref:Uncharacterized protein n=1 Tax=Eptatretus burgeri TaxID=7764 RepID=A0A8C4Q0H4_EPTBU
MFLSNSVQVVIFSLFSTLKGKVERNHDDYMETYIAHYYSQGVETKLGENISASDRQLVNIPVINVEQMKRVTRQEKRRKQMRQDLFVYILYMVTLLLLAYRQMDENAFHVHMAMEKIYALDFEISDFNGYWSWLRDTVVSNMYPEELYARYKVKSSQRTFISDLQSHR